MSRSSTRWWALAVIALAQFIVIMDTSIIGVALPEIQADLGFSQGDLSWVFNAYVIAFGGLLLLGGRLADLLGAKKMFATGWAVLAAGWPLCLPVGAQPVERAEPAQISPAGQVELARLADLTAQRLKLNLDYDAAALKAAGSITLRLEGGLSDDELWSLLNRVLATRGFTTVRVPGRLAYAVVRLADAPNLADQLLDPSSLVPVRGHSVAARTRHLHEHRVGDGEPTLREELAECVQPILDSLRVVQPIEPEQHGSRVAEVPTKI